MAKKKTIRRIGKKAAVGTRSAKGAKRATRGRERKRPETRWAKVASNRTSRIDS